MATESENRQEEQIREMACLICPISKPCDDEGEMPFDVCEGFITASSRLYAAGYRKVEPIIKALEFMSSIDDELDHSPEGQRQFRKMVLGDIRELRIKLESKQQLEG